MFRSAPAIVPAGAAVSIAAPVVIAAARRATPPRRTVGIAAFAVRHATANIAARAPVGALADTDAAARRGAFAARIAIAPFIRPAAKVTRVFVASDGNLTLGARA